MIAIDPARPARTALPAAPDDARGAALVITLLTISLLSALGMGLALSSSSSRLSGANHHDSVLLLNAAEAALVRRRRASGHCPTAR
jgi:Tfp pilus assembly protein PilX